MLPGRRPGRDRSRDGRARRAARGEGRPAHRSSPHAVGATLPPGLHPDASSPAARPRPAARHRARDGAGAPAVGLHRGGVRRRGPVAWALHTDRRRHWSPRAPLHARPAGASSSGRSRRAANPIYRQLARCALEWRCFTAQNTFYGRDEGAIPSSAACNAACIGCLSEPEEGMPPAEPRADRARAERGGDGRGGGPAPRAGARARHGELRPGLRGRAARALEGDRAGHPPRARADPARVDPREHERLAAGRARAARPTPGSTRSASRSTPPRRTCTPPTTGRAATRSPTSCARSASRRTRAPTSR